MFGPTRNFDVNQDNQELGTGRCVHTLLALALEPILLMTPHNVAKSKLGLMILNLNLKAHYQAILFRSLGLDTHCQTIYFRFLRFRYQTSVHISHVRHCEEYGHSDEHSKRGSRTVADLRTGSESRTRRIRHDAYAGIEVDASAPRRARGRTRREVAVHRLTNVTTVDGMYIARDQGAEDAKKQDGDLHGAVSDAFKSLKAHVTFLQCIQRNKRTIIMTQIFPITSCSYNRSITGK